MASAVPNSAAAESPDRTTFAAAGVTHSTDAVMAHGSSHRTTCTGEKIVAYLIGVVPCDPAMVPRIAALALEPLKVAPTS